MVRFIYLCAGILVVSLFAVPVYFGVSNERETLSLASNDEINQEESLSFQEIYALAEEGQNERGPDSLNNITPAAGTETAPDSFSSGFNKKADSALADTTVEPETPAEDQTTTE